MLPPCSWFKAKRHGLCSPPAYKVHVLIGHCCTRCDSPSCLPLQLVQETGAQGLFFNHLYDPISLVRDNEVKAAMAGMGVLCQSFNADVLYEPWEVLDKDGQPLTSFEDFWNK